MTKIAIGSDHAGFVLKESIIKYLQESGYEYKDFGTHSKESSDYPLNAQDVAKAVASGEFDKGIILCGSGIGVAIAANRIKGIRAANCHDVVLAEMSRKHNNANILTMGERVIREHLALNIVKVWLNTEFEGGRHQRRIDMLDNL
jgi:ribose 5-phosphate isomerase B